MGNDKVTLPRDVAEAIEKLRSYGFSNWNVMDKAQGAICSEPDLTLHKWAFAEEGEGTPDALMSALVNGYTIEQTPEEKVREYYKNARGEYTHLAPHYDADECDIEIAMRYKYSLGKAVAVKKTLNLLGIKIEGINA